jgi:hypothetical protein
MQLKSWIFELSKTAVILSVKFAVSLATNLRSGDILSIIIVFLLRINGEILLKVN